MPRRSSSSALFFLIVSFAMLWIPLGQHAFLVEHWMKVGTFMAPFLLFVAAKRWDSGADLSSLSLWMLVAYIVHQFEEHWIDLFGNVYAFHATVNGLLLSVFGDRSVTTEPLTPAGIFVINTSLVWLVGALAFLRSPRHAFPALAMAAIIVVNAASHIVVSVAKLAYNPGVLTSLVVFLPLGLYVYVRVLREQRADVRQVVASVIWGVLAHVIMVGGLVAGQIFGLFSETVYFAALILWSIVPVFLFTAPTAQSNQLPKTSQQAG
ncbi:MAG: HXXEE domain-containing protein [Myxococcota bacterium]